MKLPKKYKAQTQIKGDRFVKPHTREVQGYYVKHVYATPYAMSSPEGHEDFVQEHTKHYIVTDGFSDWGLPREMEFYEVDIMTLEEV